MMRGNDDDLARAIRQRVATLSDDLVKIVTGRLPGNGYAASPPAATNAVRAKPRQSARVADFDGRVMKLLRGSDMALSVGFLADRLDTTRHAVQRSVARLRASGKAFMGGMLKNARWADTPEKAATAERRADAA